MFTSILWFNQFSRLQIGSLSFLLCFFNTFLTCLITSLDQFHVYPLWSSNCPTCPSDLCHFHSLWYVTMPQSRRLQPHPDLESRITPQVQTVSWDACCCQARHCFYTGSTLTIFFAVYDLSTDWNCIYVESLK